MPFYAVIVEGVLPADTPMAPLRGFFTTRTLRVPDIETAERLAIKLVMDDWLTNHVSHPRDLPSLSVDSSWRCGFWGWLRGPNRGHTFWSDSDEGN